MLAGELMHQLLPAELAVIVTDIFYAVQDRMYID